MSSILIRIVEILIGAVVLLLLREKWLVESYKYKSRKKGCGIPAISVDRPFGFPKLIETIRRKNEFTMLEMAGITFKSLGVKTVYGQRLFNFNIITIDPENIKSVLATQFKDYSLGIRHAQISPLIGDGIFTLSGQGWKHSRTLLRPQFTREQVSQIDSLRTHVDVLLNIFKVNSAQGLFDAQPYFFSLTLDTASEFLFGESTNSLGLPPSAAGTGEKRSRNPISGAEFAEAFTAALDTLTTRLLLSNFYWLKDSKEFREYAATCKKFIDYFVHETLNDVSNSTSGDGGHDYVFIRELAKETRDPVVIRDQAFNILLAGRDTTASLLSYTMWHLAQNPRVLRKLHEAVLENFGTDVESLTFESLKRCEYLGCVLNEVLRVNPIVPLNFRFAIRDTTLPRGGGPDESQPVFVPKDTIVAYSVYALHRDKDFWGPDADDFRPERWNEHRSRTWEYLPFNGGPRICLGQQFALTEAGFTVVRILQTFSDIQIDPSRTRDDLRHNVLLTSSVAGGVPIRFIQ
jgi:cytochrome P450